MRVCGGEPGLAVVEDARVVLDAGGEPDLLHHLDVVLGALAQAMRLELLAGRLKRGELSVQLRADLIHGALDRLLLGHVVGGRPDGDVVDVVEDLAGQRVEVLDRLDLVPEQGQAIGGLGVGREHLEHLALGAEGATGERGVVALVLHADELAEGLVAIDPFATLNSCICSR